MSDRPPRRNLIDAASIVFGVDLQRSSYSWPTWVLITASFILVTGSIIAALWSPWWVAVLIWIPFFATAIGLMYRHRQPRRPAEQHPATTDGRSFS